jgi:hypothetical protein
MTLDSRPKFAASAQNKRQHLPNSLRTSSFNGGENGPLNFLFPDRDIYVNTVHQSLRMAGRPPPRAWAAEACGWIRD